MLTSFYCVLPKKGEGGEFCIPPPLDGSMTEGTWQGVQREFGAGGRAVGSWK